MGFIAFVFSNARWLAIGLLLSFSSSWGQTFFIALFSDSIRNDFSLSHSAWGGLYATGTVSSAVLMVWAGGLADRMSVARLGTFVLMGLSLACVAMAVNNSGWLIAGVILALRFFGQGMSTHVSNVAMARWFDANRGVALSVALMGVPIGNAILPFVFAQLGEVLDWRDLWLIAAGCAAIAAILLAILFGRDRVPTSHAQQKERTGVLNRHWTRGQAIRWPISWLMLPVIIGPPAWGTALLFQQVHLVTIKGWQLIDFVALFPLMTATSVATTFASGMAIDRFGAVRVVPLVMFPWALSFGVLAISTDLLFAAVGMVLFGIGTGLGATLPIAFVAEVFGTRHIGSIKAAAAAAMVLGSAVGPVLTGVLIDMGVPFERQLLAFALFFCIGGASAWIAAARVRALSAP